MKAPVRKKEKMVAAFLQRIGNGPYWSVNWSYVNNSWLRRRNPKWSKKPTHAYGLVKESDLD